MPAQPRKRRDPSQEGPISAFERWKKKRSEVDTTNRPNLVGSSIHTLNSAKASPTTPSPHAFEPNTPKAMILGPGYGSFVSTPSDPLSNLRFEPLSDALVADKAASQIDRPRSAIW
ncbi:hypothetical protein INS49_014835 [Diaporthe citri]|uniref:uncharacterized protein n=1 Tax=Diaporthe citri TaxID=83186 RepID=UPI001C7ECD26|nr:uncharacterized protein INS49_014835 [Diaporthe citri]KAG6356960.1 hypothetical protein INS49_014835 [Diaporthe citri]